MGVSRTRMSPSASSPSPLVRTRRTRYPVRGSTLSCIRSRIWYPYGHGTRMGRSRRSRPFLRAGGARRRGSKRALHVTPYNEVSRQRIWERLTADYIMAPLRPFYCLLYLDRQVKPAVVLPPWPHDPLRNLGFRGGNTPRLYPGPTFFTIMGYMYKCIAYTPLQKLKFVS